LTGVVSAAPNLLALEVEGGSITGLPFFGEHCDLNLSSKMAHLVSLHHKSFLLAVDSNIRSDAA
jgi:hypothetical protein